MTEALIEDRGVTKNVVSHLGLLGGAVRVPRVRRGHTRSIHSVNNAVESSHRSLSQSFGAKRPATNSEEIGRRLTDRPTD